MKWKQARKPVSSIAVWRARLRSLRAKVGGAEREVGKVAVIKLP